MIPRIVHQAWVGPKPIPAREKSWCDEMKSMNPTWTVKLYGNELLERYGQDPYVKSLLDLKKPWAFITDRLRILLLRDEGGCWLDPDCQPCKPLDSLNPLWDGPHTFVAGFRSPDRPDVALHRGVTLLDDTFLASAPGSRMVKRLDALWRPQNVVVDGHAIGVEIIRNMHADVAMLGYRYFYNTQKTPETIALHDSHNLGSWCDQVRDEQKLRLASV